MTSVIRLPETALYVADLDRSYDFYNRVLGLGPDVGTTAPFYAVPEALNLRAA